MSGMANLQRLLLVVVVIVVGVSTGALVRETPTQVGSVDSNSEVPQQMFSTTPVVSREFVDPEKLKTSVRSDCLTACCLAPSISGYGLFGCLTRNCVLDPCVNSCGTDHRCLHGCCFKKGIF